jgi:hypothetical protein
VPLQCFTAAEAHRVMPGLEQPAGSLTARCRPTSPWSRGSWLADRHWRGDPLSISGAGAALMMQISAIRS